VAGMGGGCAYVLDENGEFQGRVNDESVGAVALTDLYIHQERLRGLIAEHLEETGSANAERILANFDEWIPECYLIKPQAADLRT
ncbi:hypothetical protein, partial [Vibrio cholerae]|uniref:hypothetical protein n=1 Tax=Vibrio cholerae TaxID=666 RepID=UPI001C119B1F